MEQNEPKWINGPFDYPYVFVIGKPTTKWNAITIYHILKQLNVENLNEYTWDAHMGNVMYVIKDHKVYFMAQGFQPENPKYHPDLAEITSQQGVYINREDLESNNTITGIDTWIMQAVKPGYTAENTLRNQLQWAFICALYSGFIEYCKDELGYEVESISVPYQLHTYADDDHKYLKSTYFKGTYEIESEHYIYRYFSVTCNNKKVFIDSCITHSEAGWDESEYNNKALPKKVVQNKIVQVGRDHGPGYIVTDDISYQTMILNGYEGKFRCCIPGCIGCKFHSSKTHNIIMQAPEGPRMVQDMISVCTKGVGIGYPENMEYFDLCIPVGNIYKQPTKILGGALNINKESIYNNAEGSSEASKNNSKTKTQQIMAAKTTSIFDRMINKYLGQYKPTKIDGFAMTLDGNIALASGEGEFTAIVDDHLEVYPAETVLTDIPFFSLQRPINQVKAGDYIFITTGEGRKLAKVTGINKAKDGKVKSLTVTRFSGINNEVAAITDKLTGLTTIEVVLNLFDSCQFPGMGDGRMNPLMMMALLKDDKGSSSVENILMMSMMMGGNGFKFPGIGDCQMNPLVMMAFLKDGRAGESGIDGLGKLLAMSMMMGNGNPFAQMVAPAAPTRVPRKPAKKTDPAPDPDPDPTQEPAGEGE